MHHGNIVEPCAESLNSLRCKGNLWEHNDSGFFLLQSFFNRPYVKLGLAAVGNAVQNCYAESARICSAVYSRQGLSLVVVEADYLCSYRHPFRNGRQGFQNRLLGYFNNALLGQFLYRRVRTADSRQSTLQLQSRLRI